MSDPQTLSGDGANARADRRFHVLTLSADSVEGLDAAAERLARRLRDDPAVSLADLAFTLQTARPAARHRRAIVAADRDGALAALAGEAAARTASGEAPKEPPSVAFLFSGQGAQYPGMGLGIYRTEPTFREEVDRCCEILRPHLGLDLRDLLLVEGEAAEAAKEELDQTRNTQPALFVVEYSTARLWMEWGITPDVMIGHSIGEYVAACLAGVMSLDDALGLVAARGRMMQSLPPGSMLAVPMSEEQVTPLLGEELSLAATNAGNRLVVSGPDPAIDALAERLRGERVMATKLHTSHAFHSLMMEPILEPFVAEVAKVELAAPRTPYVSNVTGTWITADEATDPEYYARHLRQAVRFTEGVGELLRQDPGRVLLEAGPGKTLVTLSQRHPERQKSHILLTSLRHPKDAIDDDLHLADSLARLWVAGVDVFWSGYWAYVPHRAVELDGWNG